MTDPKNQKTGRKRKKSPLPGIALMLVVIGGVAAGLHFTGKLQPLIDRTREMLGQTTPEPIQQPEVDPTDSAPSSTVIEPSQGDDPIIADTSPSTGQEPTKADDALAAKYRKRFKKPIVGKKMILTLKSKVKRKGILERIDAESVTITTGSVQMTLTRAQLGPAGLARCYEDDYVKYMVAMHRRKERQAKARQEQEKKMMAEYAKFMAAKGTKINTASAKARKQSIHDIDFKEYMEKNGATEMLKARQQRIKEYEAERMRAGREY